MNLYNVLSNRYVGMSNFERLFAKKFGGTGEKIKELEGVPPLTFTANGQPLLDYLISGNIVQNGTPTPENPIMPSGCGELETTGAHAGQYKLPLTSAGQNVDIYLGEVQTTRRIKKLVLTGKEAWLKSSSGYNGFYFIMPTKLQDSALICNIATFTRLYDNYTNYPWFCVSDNAFGISTDSAVIGGTTVADFKAYLAAQYAAGTPVTVWYVLAEPETGIVNEPLMKIGDYADTVSMEQAEVSIPTNKGSTTLDVDTTIKPSNVYIKYRN